MDIKPVNKYKKPSYPAKDEVMRNPLLLKSMPERWKGNIAVTAALTSLLAITAAGCSTAGVGKTNDSVSSIQDHEFNAQNSKSLQKDKDVGNNAAVNSNGTDDSRSTGMNGGIEGDTLENSQMYTMEQGIRDKIVPETADEGILRDASKITNEPDSMPEATPQKNEFYRAKNSNDEADVQDVIISNDLSMPPVFVHGDGRGSFGCMSIAPPVFLSEDEAYEVITKEAEKFGLAFSKETAVIKDVFIPANVTENISSSEREMLEKGYFKVRKGNLLLDGNDENKKVAFEFVSVDDLNEWKLYKHKLDNNGKYYTVESSVEQFYTMAAANSLREGLGSKAGDTKVGIFYDPMPDYTEEQFEILRSDVYDQNALSKLAAEQKEKAKEQLREQVIDFLNWLKGQGII